MLKPETVSINFATLNGESHFVSVPLHASFGTIKTTILEPLLGIPAMTITLVFVGAALEDTATPYTANCMDETVVHIVRFHDDKIFGLPIKEQECFGNCQYCHTRGVKFTFRPMCGACGSEMVIEPSLEIAFGETTWSELTDQTCMCYACGAKAEGNVPNTFPTGIKRPLHFGVLCDTRHLPNATRCPTRKFFEQDLRSKLHRKKLHVFDGTNTLEVVNTIYGYAFAGGYEMYRNETL